MLKLFVLISFFIIFLFSFLFFALPAKACAGPNCSENNYFPSCTYHAYKDCADSSVYWYDSCGNLQDLIQNCSAQNQICKYGECAAYYNPATVSKPAPVKVLVPPPAPVLTPVSDQNQQAASVASVASISSSSPTTSGFMEFLKRWYAWILIAIVLIVLFFVIFRRLSSDR